MKARATATRQSTVRQAPVTASAERGAHRTEGGSNQAAIRAGPRIGRSNDPLEREADRVADAVLSGGPAGPLTAAPGAMAQRKCAACEKEDERETLQRKETGPASPLGNTGAAAAAQAVATRGAPLASDVRAYFEPRFGRDLSHVRVHTDASAAQAARSINARAFTLGNDVAFAAGEYDPDSFGGRRLIAHEIAHTLQQGGAGIIRRACPESSRDEFERKATEAQDHAAYQALSDTDRAVADAIILNARSSPRCLYYIDKLLLLLNTPDAPAESTASEARADVGEAVETEEARVAGGGGNTTREEDLARHPSRNWTRRTGEDRVRFRVDNSDPNNIIVQMRVQLRPEGEGTEDDVENTKALEDAIEKQSSTRGYVVDIVFVERGGRDVFNVGVDPSEWTTSHNWVGDPYDIAHEAHHLLGLDDRYDYIEDHADNADMAMGERLHWFREQMSRQSDPEGVQSLMGEGSALLDDDVCNVAGLDAESCIEAREAGESRAAAAASPSPAGEMQTTGLCIKSFFGGELTFSGLSAGELSDIAVINEGSGLTLTPVNGTTYECDGFWYRFRSSVWFKIPDHCAVEVTASPHRSGFYSQCCNLAAGLVADDPHWSTDALSHDKRNPFS